MGSDISCKLLNPSRASLGGLVAGLLLAGCATAPQKPSWVDRPRDAYPDGKFVVAVGRDLTLDAARAAARGELAAQLSSRISQKETYRARQTTGGLDEQVRRNWSREAETETRVTTDLVLEGTEVRETWTDKKMGVVHALAVLDRPAARERIEKKAAAQEQDAARERAAAGQASTELERLRCLARALRAAEAAEEIRRPLGALGGAPGRSPAAVSAGEEFAGALKTVRLAVAAGDPAVSRAATESLAGLGVYTSPPPAPYTLEAAVEISSVDRGDPTWKYAHWKARVEVLDGRRVAGAASREGQVGQLSPDAARQKALAEGLKSVRESLVRRALLGDETSKP